MCLEFYNGDSDPYEKVKQLGDKFDKGAKNDARGAVDEINAAGRHVKNAAQYAGDAARDVFGEAKREGRAVANDIKRDAQDLRTEAEKFASEHHLKEGDRSPEDVLSHTHDNASSKATGVAENLKSDANEAAFNIANKFKGTKESVSNEFNKDNKQNPLVFEKSTTDKTKTPYEARLEEHAQKNVHDTSGLVGKDTDKVSKVWDDKNEREKDPSARTLPTDHNEKKSSVLGSIFGKGESSTKAEHDEKVSKADAEQASRVVYDQASIAHGNPMVREKHSTEKTKPGWENRLEEYAQAKVHDTSTLVGKDTEKVRSVWDDKTSRDLGHGGIPPVEETNTSYWSSLFGQAKEVEQKVEERLEKDVEKATNLWEGVKSKVGMATNDVKDDASETYQEVKGKVASEANNVGSSWNKVKSQVKDDASAVYDKAADTASNVSDKLKKETDKAASNLDQAQNEAQNKGYQLKRDISGRVQNEKERASGSLNDLHNEVSANAEKWKDQTEETAKSWYEKGTEQVKSSLNTAKNVADRDIHWAEEKVQDGLATAKQEVDRLFGAENPKESGYTGHVLRGEKFAEEEEGQLRHTRANTGMKPAEVVVENASGKEL